MLELQETEGKCPRKLTRNNFLKGKDKQVKIKRLFDITASLFGLIFLSPFLLLISIFVKVDSKGPILFRQVRVGRDENNFNILKFRTMISDAEKKGMQITVGEDKRITKLGYFLRKFKLDELPQLLNVLKGDMSFVGPRPEVPKYVALYNENQKKVLKVRPGITDLASIEYRDESLLLSQYDDPERVYIEEIMPKKIELNLMYIRDMSVITDIKLIVKTLLKLIKC